MTRNEGSEQSRMREEDWKNMTWIFQREKNLFIIEEKLIIGIQQNEREGKEKITLVFSKREEPIYH